ncbi:hypothetical protein HPB52_007906 [Rhipicephalus sanguineus]|uniref:Tc1-like transposase DDE domain-containing protein n=1 Tax=Rhipicephalus sanguineus TaxID=34632 RepID=A0A9D4PV11_RHISA|nr:hypothetical protein HPB52_007906 [Rhipicephalus sanguineus]
MRQFTDMERSGRLRTEEADRLITAAIVPDPFQSAEDIREALSLTVSSETKGPSLRHGTATSSPDTSFGVRWMAPSATAATFFNTTAARYIKHVSTQSLLEEHAVCQLEWPPCGADLNPIENVWGMSKKRPSKRFNRGGTADTPWQAIAQEWENLRGRPDIIKSLYESMPTRINKQNLGAGDQIPAATVT